MDNEQDISFEEFEDAFSDGGNQTEVTEEVETETEEQEGGQQGEEETPTGEDTPSEQKEPGEEKPEGTKPETFTLKVNKEADPLIFLCSIIIQHFSSIVKNRIRPESKAFGANYYTSIPTIE